MKFAVPEAEIIRFSAEDILTTSESYQPSPPFEPDCPVELPMA